MSQNLAPTADLLDAGTTTYEDVRVLVTPEGPRHFDVQVRDADGDGERHAVEHLVVNGTEVLPDGPIWFADVDVDVGVPIGVHGDYVWVWP